MTSEPLDDFFGPEVIAAGLPGRRAGALLFVIENRVVQLLAAQHQTLERLLPDELASERELAFLQALASAGDSPQRLTIQDLEQHAPRWRHLVPRNPNLQAALARHLARKYAFSAAFVPGIRAALGLDHADVQQAFQRLYGRPLASIYRPHLPLREGLRWRWRRLATWLQHLPPFWSAYALTLTETVGASILALPIALSGVGLLPGLALLVVLGLVNILTVACLAEAVSRNGIMRYGTGFLGRVVQDYLGASAALLMRLTIFLLAFLLLQAYSIGVGLVLQDATLVPAPLWVLLLFGAELYYLRSNSLNATVASALLIGALNIGLIVALCLLALPHLRSANLLYSNLPFVGGRPFQPGILELIFGVVLGAYFGHLSVGLCGRVVLRRDPSGRSLLWGCVAAQATAVVLYCFWAFSVNGAIAPALLQHERGTVLGALADVAGPLVHLLGALLAVLGMGMGSIHMALALYNLTRELLPSAAQLTLLLPRERAQLSFYTRRRRGAAPAVQLGLRYLGLRNAQPCFRLDLQAGGLARHFETSATGQLHLAGAQGYAPLLEHAPALRRPGTQLTLEPVDVSEQAVQLRITTTLRLVYQGEWAHTRPLAPELLEHEPASSPAPGAPRNLPLALQRLRLLLLGRAGRFWVGASPVVATFLLAEWSLLSGGASFAGLLSIIGVLVVSLLAGIFPVLLLLASRQKGDQLPGVVYRLLGHPLLLAAIYLLSLSSIFVHGLLLWENPLQRAIAMLVGLLTVGVTLQLARSGTFAPRTTVMLQVDQQPEQHQARFLICAGGQLLPTRVALTYEHSEQRLESAAGALPDFAALIQVRFLLRPAPQHPPSRELKVWAFQLDPEGDLASLPARLRVEQDGITSEFDLALCGGQVLLPLISPECQVHLAPALQVLAPEVR